MKRAALISLGLAALASGCGFYDSWSKRRQARELEEDIRGKNAAMKKLSPNALERAEADSREKAIAQYEKILRDYSDVGKEEMDEALYLLGRLLFDREQQAFQRAQLGFEADRARAAEGGLPAPEEPRPRYPSAKAVYERLVKEFPKSQFREDALYDLGYILNEEGDREGGSKLFAQLLKEKPKGRYAAEVNFRLGEYAFDHSELAAAEAHYKDILRTAPEELKDKALFKLGWVYFNLDRYDDAKQVLAELLRREGARFEREGREFAPAPILFFPGPRRAALKDVLERERKGADLYQETLEIIARVYAESGGADALLAFIRSEQRGRAMPPYAAPLMHRLALVQKERAQFEPAARAYQLLLDTFPTFRDAPKIELELVDVYLGQKETELAARVREAMLTKYDVGSPWARANAEQEHREAALKAARKGLSWAIRYYHSTGLTKQEETGGVPEELRKAIALYERYLTRFPEGKVSYTRRYRYAQALYAANEYAKAADVFRAVAADLKFDKRREEAAFARILSVEKLVENRQPPLPQPILDSLVASYEDYIALNPRSERNSALLFKEGSLYFAAERYPASIAAFQRLIREHPGDAFAAEANDLIAQAHFKLGDYAIAEEWSQKALVSASPQNPLGQRRDEVEKLYALTMFKQGEKAAEEKQYGEATKHYLRLADQLPRNEVAARALYNAAAATDRAGKADEAARLYERLLGQYAAADLAPDAAVKLAEYYKGRPDGADRIIAVYEQVADFHVEDPKGEEFLFLAGKLAAKERRVPETTRLFEKFLSRYRSEGSGVRAERSLEALYHLGVTYSGTGNQELARRSLEQFLSRPHPAKASFGEEVQGYAFATANAHLLLGRALQQDYQAVRIVPPVAENLKRKQAMLATVVDRYTPAVASGISPIATEASFAIGRSYEEFAVAIEESPRPAGLSDEERIEYDRLLEGQIRPFLRKAVDAYGAPVRASREKSAEDEWVGRCRERLAATAPRVFQRMPRPGYLHLPAAADAPPEVIATFGGKAVSSDGPGFFRSLVADDAETREGSFAKGLAAARETPPDWEEAAKEFRDASVNGPPEASYNAAVALVRQSRPSDALRSLEDVLRRAPDFQPAIGLAAKLYEQSGRWDLAAGAYQKAAESPSASTKDRVALGGFLERQKKPAEAIAAYQAALASDPLSGEAGLGALRLNGSSDPAEFEKLLAPLGMFPRLLVDLGILAGERDQPRVAARAFASARAATPTTQTLAAAVIANNEALAAVAASDLEGATQLVRVAEHADPTLVSLANTRGIVLMRRGDFQAAEAEFRKAQVASPTFGAPWANLGILNELYFGAPEQAVEYYNRYLATHPADQALVEGWIREIREGAHGRQKSV